MNQLLENSSSFNNSFISLKINNLPDNKQGSGQDVAWKHGQKGLQM
jgi:hypothetical protein